MKFLSKSFVWTRISGDLQRCEGAPGAQPIKAKPAASQAKPTVEAAATPPKAPAASDAAMMAPVTPPAPKPATAPTAPAAKQAAATPATLPQKKADRYSDRVLCREGVLDEHAKNGDRCQACDGIGDTSAEACREDGYGCGQ